MYPKVAIREDNTLAENFGRVYDQYENVAERPELKERLVELQEQYGQDGEGDGRDDRVRVCRVWGRRPDR